MGGMRRPVEPSIPCTSLPQMPACSGDMNISTSSGASAGTGNIHQLKLSVFRQLQRLHRLTNPAMVNDERADSKTAAVEFFSCPGCTPPVASESKQAEV